MPRVIELTTHHTHTDSIVKRLDEMDGIIAVAVNDAASVSPPGDVVRIQATNSGARNVTRGIEELGTSGIIAFTSSEPLAMVAPHFTKELDNEWSDASWTDVAGFLREESNPEPNIVLLMMLSGAIASVGIATDAIYIVIGAMVVAPGFEPFMRVPFALISGPRRTLRQAIASVIIGFAAMGAGAAGTYAVLRGVGGADQPLESLGLVAEWSSLTAATYVVSTVAGLAGAITVSADRAVFTSGVLITVALVPGITLLGMGLVAGNSTIALDGLLQWAVNGAIVLVTSAVVIGLKHHLHNEPRSL